MIHPSYTELIEAINTNNEDDDESMVLNSRYSLVLATSKRARQLIAGAKPLVEKAAGKKPLSIAIDELYQGKVKILPGKSEDEEIALEENVTLGTSSVTWADDTDAETAGEDDAENEDNISSEDEAEEDSGEKDAGTEPEYTEEESSDDGLSDTEDDFAGDSDENPGD